VREKKPKTYHNPPKGGKIQKSEERQERGIPDQTLSRKNQLDLSPNDVIVKERGRGRTHLAREGGRGNCNGYK